MLTREIDLVFLAIHMSFCDLDDTLFSKHWARTGKMYFVIH